MLSFYSEGLLSVSSWHRENLDATLQALQALGRLRRFHLAFPPAGAYTQGECFCRRSDWSDEQDRAGDFPFDDVARTR